MSFVAQQPLAMSAKESKSIIIESEFSIILLLVMMRVEDEMQPDVD